MKKIVLKITNFLILFMLFSNNIHAQEIMPYEGEISNSDEYVFHEIDVSQEKEGFKLSGTLITPSTDYEKVVILVPGAGKDSRHSHHILTQELLKNRIAVFRYDERGVGKSGSEYNLKYGISKKTTDLYYVMQELMSDSLIRGKRLGLIGHSEGGLICLGTIKKGLNPDFLVLLSTPASNITKVLKYQIKTGVNPQKKKSSIRR